MKQYNTRNHDEASCSKTCNQCPRKNICLKTKAGLSSGFVSTSESNK
jgi:hypothetical protein